MYLRYALITVTVLSAALFVGCGEQSASNNNTQAVKPAAESSTDGYPLDVCVVSGEPLGSMGDPVVIEHEGREVRFCCAGCADEFEKNPDKYLAKLDGAKSDGGGHDDHAGHNH